MENLLKLLYKCPARSTVQYVYANIASLCIHYPLPYAEKVLIFRTFLYFPAQARTKFYTLADSAEYKSEEYNSEEQQ